MRKLSSLFGLLVLGWTLGMLPVAGCEEGPVEEAGEQVDDAADNVADGVEDAVDELD